MSSNIRFHLDFTHQNRAFEVDFQEAEGKGEGNRVSLEGRSYALKGEDSSLQWLESHLPGIFQSKMTLQELTFRLQEAGATEIGVMDRVQSSVAPFLSAKSSPKESLWSQRKREMLPQKQKAVAKKYWEASGGRLEQLSKALRSVEKLKNQRDSCGKGKAGRAKKRNLEVQVNESEKRLLQLSQPDTMFLHFLKQCSSHPQSVEKGFVSAVKQKSLHEFQKLFANLTESQLEAIDAGERLNTFPLIPMSQNPVKITESDLKALSEYMKETGFSGVVFLSDSQGTHVVSSSNIPDANLPFAIHSVGKAFTGALAICLIEEQKISEEDLKSPIQLSSASIEKLSPAVQEQLKKTTLREVMLHYGKYGDYLGKYQDAIDEALQANRPPPTIDSPEDFLQFADENLVVPDSSGYSYSNLGLLLAGLSIQHIYNLQNEEKKSYDELLRDYVLDPCGVEVYANHRPENARFNSEDSVSAHIVGGPAGGAWTRAEDLGRFANWLGDKYRDKEGEFADLVNEFGGEFFSNREFAHGGSIDASSAHLSHRLENEVSITIVSDKEGFRLASELADTIQENLFCYPTP